MNKLIFNTQSDVELIKKFVSRIGLEKKFNLIGKYLPQMIKSMSKHRFFTSLIMLSTLILHH